MDYSNLSLFSLMRAKLDYMSQRQTELARNIANADTPGYKARDIVEPDFSKMVSGGSGGSQKLKMTVTNPKDIGGAATDGSGLKSDKRKTTYELKPSGGNVVIEEEIAKAGQNQIEYQKVLNLYGKTISMFKTALGVSGA